jgi:hypothetical protein
VPRTYVERHLPRATIPALAWVIAAALAVLLAVVASNGLVLVAVLTAAGVGAVARYGRR